MRRILTAIALGLVLSLQAYAQATLKEGMEQLRQKYGISYIYDSSLPVGKPYNGEKLNARTLKSNLSRLLKDTGIEYEIKGRQVILKRKKIIQADTNLSEVQILDSSMVVDWRMPILTHPEAGALGITRLTVEQAPVLLGEKDVLKTIQMLPGVQAAAEGYSGISVRGGYADENLILLDGVPIVQTDHCLGLFSIFPAESVDGATVWKGNFPAKYGGRASGVVDIQSASGNRDRIKGGFTVGLLSDKIQADGPIGKNLAFNVNARLLHTFLAQPVISSLDQGANYWFYDVNARLDWYFSDSDQLTLSAYNSSDLLEFHERSYEYEHRYDENYAAYNIWTNRLGSRRFGWGSSAGILSWKHAETGRTTFAVTNTRMKTFTHSRADIETDGVFSTEEQNYEASSAQTDILLRSDWRLGIFSFGGEYTRHWFDIPANQAAVYADASIPLGYGISLTPGLRLSLFNAMGTTWFKPEPRLSVRWQSENGWQADAGYSRMVQYIHRIPSGYSSFPTDTWHPVSAGIPPLVADQISICGRFEGFPGWELSAEFYYKLLDGTLEYKDSYAAIDSGQEEWVKAVASGKGSGMGMELLVRRTSGRITGWLGYTLSSSTRVFPDGSINNGRPYPASTDRRHRINFCATWAINNAVDFTLAWTFASGSPVTVPERYSQIITEGNPVSIQYAPGRNNYRLPPVHRADISVNFRKPCRRGERIWTIGLYNLYGAQNPDFFYYSSTTDHIVGSPDYYPDYPNGTPYLRTTSYLMFIPTISFSRNF